MRVPLTLLIALGAAFLTGDHGPPPGRIVSGVASPHPFATTAGDFHLFGWFSPPTDSTREARIAEVAGAGFDLMLHAWADSGARETNRRRLDLAGPLGMRCMLWDRRMDAFDALDPSSAAGGAALDTIVADWAGDSAFFGYYLGDEPHPEAFDLLARLHAALRARDPAHPGWNNLLGRGAFPSRDAWLDYTRDYVERVRPAVLCNDHYDFTRRGDRGRFVENAAGLAAVAREHGLPWWGTIQLVEHGEYRLLTAGEVRWQAAMLLAYGARGMGYFTYWTPAPDPRWNWRPAMIAYDGARTAWYDTVAAINRDVRVAGEALAACTWLASEHAGSVPEGATRFASDDLVAAVEGRAVLANFADTMGHHVLFVANPDSSHTRSVVLRFAGWKDAWRLEHSTGAWALRDPEADSLALSLPPGGFELLRFGGRSAPRSIVAGSPAEVAVSDSEGLVLHVEGAGGGGSIEVLDGAGRRLWSTTLVPGSNVLRCRPPRGDPRYVRIEDPDGVRVQDLGWRRHP